MARNYRYLTNHRKETTDTGGWFKVATFQHNHPRSGGSGWLDRAVINYMVDDITGTDAIRSSFPFGMMFALSHDSVLGTVDGEANQLSPLGVLDIAARDGGGGSVTLRSRKAIKENVNDSSEGDGKIHLWVKNTDLTVTDDLVFRFYIETFGRWVECLDA